MTKISFIGDVMLGRIIGQRYGQKPYPIVEEALRKEIRNADLVFANLESPVAYESQTEGDHLQFRGNPDTLDELKWIDVFSLSNNHITDCGTAGINETIKILEQKGFAHNGIYADEYKPFLYEHDGEKIAIVTVTDMLNIPFAEDCLWKTLRVGDPKVIEVVDMLHKKDYCVIVFAHIGMLFTRYPNPFTCDYLKECIENGADMVVSAHSHCLGGMEYYKEKAIFYGLGDFVMDGNSFRRRKSAALQLEIEGKKVMSWKLIPAMINSEYLTVKPDKAEEKRMINGFNRVSEEIAAHESNYSKYFKYRYKLEIINHTCSTIHFLCKQRGLTGMLKMVNMRFEEVLRMFTWVSKDRSGDRRDDDAIKADRKKISDKELFN